MDMCKCSLLKLCSPILKDLSILILLCINLFDVVNFSQFSCSLFVHLFLKESSLFSVPFIHLSEYITLVILAVKCLSHLFLFCLSVLSLQFSLKMTFLIVKQPVLLILQFLLKLHCLESLIINIFHKPNSCLLLFSPLILFHFPLLF